MNFMSLSSATYGAIISRRASSCQHPASGTLVIVWVPSRKACDCTGQAPWRDAADGAVGCLVSPRQATISLIRPDPRRYGCRRPRF